MRFLDDMKPAHRNLLMDAGEQRSFSQDTPVIQRGQQATHLFVVERGSLALVDSRTNPETVLEVIGPGAVAGALSWLDGAPSHAELRAVEPSVVRAWSNSQLQSMLQQSADFSADFHRAIAQVLAHRYRALHGTMASGGSAGPRPSTGRQELARQARDHASEVLYAWVDADERLRADGTDARARALIRTGLDFILGDITRWLTGLPDLQQRATAGAMLSRELRPHLVRSTTGERTLDALGQAAGDPRLLAHVIRGEASGKGTFGHNLDGQLLSLPTFEAIRTRAARLVEVGRSLLHADRPSNLLVLHPNCGAVLVGLLMPMSIAGGSIRVMDGNQNVLGMVDAGLPRRPSRIQLTFHHADMAALALGRIDRTFDPHDTVVLDGILDHLPDRLAISLLTWCARQLVPGGTLLCSGLAPAPDALATDHIFGWPLVRRSSAALAGLVNTVPGLRAAVVSGESIGVVVQATSTVSR